MAELDEQAHRVGVGMPLDGAAVGVVAPDLTDVDGEWPGTENRPFVIQSLFSLAQNHFPRKSVEIEPA